MRIPVSPPSSSAEHVLLPWLGEILDERAGFALHQGPNGKIDDDVRGVRSSKLLSSSVSPIFGLDLLLVPEFRECVLVRIGS